MIDVNSIKQRIDEFHERHGDFVCMGGNAGGWLLYQDGAHRDRDPMGILAEPPDDPYERSKMIAKFWTAKRDLACDEFQTYKHELAMLARATLGQSVPGVVPDQDEARKKLTKLRRKVTNNQRKLDRALEELEACKPSWMKVREEQNNRNRRAAQELLSTVESIEV